MSPNGPRELLDSVSQTLATRDQLELENRALRQELLLKNSDLLMLGQYKQENARLRELLGSPLRQDEQKNGDAGHLNGQRPLQRSGGY